MIRISGLGYQSKKSGDDFPHEKVVFWYAPLYIQQVRNYMSDNTPEQMANQSDAPLRLLDPKSDIIQEDTCSISGIE